MGRGVAFLSLVGGLAVCAASLGLLPSEYVAIDAPPALVTAGGAVLALAGFMALARDHRGAEAIASIAVLAIAVFAGWATFYAPEGTVERWVPFIPASVNVALGRLLFGIGAALCVGMGFWGLRRLFR